jgi:hypothetical protein
MREKKKKKKKKKTIKKYILGVVKSNPINKEVWRVCQMGKRLMAQ